VVINASNNAVACGVAVVVTHQQTVLFGKRATKSTEFDWQLPGGWIEAGEAPREAARREVLEETGLSLQDLKFVGLTSNVFYALNHSISLYFEAECTNPGPLTVVESDKCIAWEWRSWSEVNDNLFLPLRLFKNTGYQPFSKDQQQTYVSI